MKTNNNLLQNKNKIMTTTTTFKVGKTYPVHQGNVIFTYSNDIYFYGKATVSGSHTHWHSGVIRDDGTLVLDAFVDSDMYKFSEEYVKGQVDAFATKRVNRLRAEAEVKSNGERRTEQAKAISLIQTEAKQARSDAFFELNKIVCSGSDFATILSNKKAKELIEKISLIDAFLPNNFNHQWLTA